MQYWIVVCREENYPYYDSKVLDWSRGDEDGKRKHQECVESMQDGDKVLCYVSDCDDKGIWAILRVGSNPTQESINLVWEQDLYIPLTTLQVYGKKLLELNPQKYAFFHTGKGLVQTGTFFATTQEQFETICGLECLARLIETDYKPRSLPKGAAFKRIFQDFSHSIFEKNIHMLHLRDESGYLGEFPILYSENSSYSAIGAALHEITPYVYSECSIKHKDKAGIESDTESIQKQADKNGSVDFWCYVKDGAPKDALEIWIEAKRIDFNIGKRAEWQFHKYAKDCITDALKKLQRIQSESVGAMSDNILRVALLINPVWCKKDQQSNEDTIRAKTGLNETNQDRILTHIQKTLTQTTKEITKDLGIQGDVNILTSVLDFKDSQEWHIYKDGEYLHSILLHAIVLEGLE